MNRKEIKSKAWEISKAHFKDVWIVYGFVLIFDYLINTLSNTLLKDFSTCLWKISNKCIISVGGLSSFIVSLVLSLGISFLVFGVYKCLLNIVRGKKVEFNDIFVYKNDWLKLFGISFITSLLINLGSLLIIPGIILEIVYSMRCYVYADNEGSIKETLASSRELIKGYKWDYFIFNLSFIGWIMLIVVTLGIAMIWVMPFILIAQTLYYEELKKAKNTKQAN